MSDLFDIIDDFNDKVNEIFHNCTEVDGSQIGLDIRAGSFIRINPDDGYIIVRKGSKNNLEYYGGFEYVDREYVTETNNFVIYFAESGRVQECLDYSTEHAQ